MNFTEFVEQVQNLLREKDDRLDFSIQTVRKNNSVKYTGVSIKSATSVVAPIIYLEPFFQRYEDTNDMDDVIDRIMKIYQQNEFHFDADSIMDFQSVKARIICVVVNKHRNVEMLSEVPNRELVGDIAVTYKIMLDNMQDGSTASIQIKNSMLDIWKVDEDTLWTTAKENIEHLNKPECRNMYEVLLEMMASRQGSISHEQMKGLRDAEPRMYILSNKSRLNGAAVIADSVFMKEIHDDIGNFYILPSSLHEVIAVPAIMDCDVETMNEMVRSVNETQLSEEDILADQVYYYDGNKITVAR